MEPLHHVRNLCMQVSLVTSQDPAVCHFLHECVVKDNRVCAHAIEEAQTDKLLDTGIDLLGNSGEQGDRHSSTDDSGDLQKPCVFRGQKVDAGREGALDRCRNRCVRAAEIDLPVALPS